MPSTEGTGAAAPEPNYPAAGKVNAAAGMLYALAKSIVEWHDDMAGNPTYRAALADAAAVLDCLAGDEPDDGVAARLGDLEATANVATAYDLAAKATAAARLAAEDEASRHDWSSIYGGRNAQDGERCQCGRPAVVVFDSGVAWCGINDGGQR